MNAARGAWSMLLSAARNSSSATVRWKLRGVGSRARATDEGRCVLAGNDAFWAAFVMAGALKGSYDVGLWVWGLKVKLHEHEKPVVRQAKRQGEGDEEEGSS